MARRFNRKQKAALFSAADGKCSNCGKPLQPGWHADHVQPYSKDGVTDVSNGQALCPECNLRKGSSSMLPEWTKTLLPWQIEGYREFRNYTGTHFTLVAPPATGKTTFGIYVAHTLLDARIVDHVGVVSPTDRVRTQWADNAHSHGIDLDTEHWGAKLKPDFHGFSTTYQSVAINSEYYRTLCCTGRWLMIFDEPHHMASDLKWGLASKHAFDQPAVVKRLAESGTLWRTDKEEIGLLSYENGKVKVHYRYPYTRALAEFACRYVFFPKYEGRMEWLSRDGTRFSSTFAESLNEMQRSERLRTSLDPRGDFVVQVLTDADRALTDKRNNGHRDAAGLAICMGIPHARAICGLLRKITGTEPVLVLSDDKAASANIDQFVKSNVRWIVAVDMIAEGVDIPRLCVLAYLTNVTSRLYFIQSVGRITRMQKGVKEQTALVFMPEDPELVDFARSIMDERDHQIAAPEDTYFDPNTGEEVPIPREYAESWFTPIFAEARPNGAYADEKEIPQVDYDEANKIAAELGQPNYGPFLAKAFRLQRQQSNGGQSSTNATPPPDEPRKTKRLAKLKSECQTKVRIYAFRNGLEPQAVHTMWLKMTSDNKWFPGKHHSQQDIKFTEDEAKGKMAWILELLARGES